MSNFNRQIARQRCKRIAEIEYAQNGTYRVKGERGVRRAGPRRSMIFGRAWASRQRTVANARKKARRERQAHIEEAARFAAGIRASIR